jgi:hypothetical protein
MFLSYIFRVEVCKLGEFLCTSIYRILFLEITAGGRVGLALMCANRELLNTNIH